MRSKASAVVLGGPAITDVAIATDGEAPDVADYYGYSNAGSAFDDGPFKDPAGGVFSKKFGSRLVSATEQDYAYITLDAVRLAGTNLAAVTGGDGDLDVTFELRRVTGSTGPVVAAFATAVDATTLGWWITDTVTNGTGEPYRNVVWKMPTGLQGDFQLAVTVEGTELGRKPTFSIRNSMFTDSFDDGAAGWTLFGQPTSPGPKTYPTDYIIANADFEANTDLFKGVASVELQQTQQLLRTFDTSNRHNIRLGLRFAQAGFGSTESINVEWSYDYVTKKQDAHWAPVNGFPKTGSTNIPNKLQKDPVFIGIANGSPNTDPVVIGADNNSDFALRLSINAGTNATPRAYFDTLTIDGT